MNVSGIEEKYGPDVEDKHVKFQFKAGDKLAFVIFEEAWSCCKLA